MNSIKRLLLLFLAVKTVHLAILYLSPTQFDISSQALLKKYSHERTYLIHAIQLPNEHITAAAQSLVGSVLTNVVDKLVAWDAVYFSDLFSNGLTFEHQYVFCPLWWRLVRMVPIVSGAPFYSRLISATILSNLCHFGAAVVLGIHTRIVFRQARIFPPEKMALLASSFFILSPGAAILTAPYSESIAALFSFTCFCCREKALEFAVGAKKDKSSRKVLYIASGLAAALALGFRANCLLLGLLYVYDLVLRKTTTPLLPLIAGSILGFAFLLSNVFNYTDICLTGDRGEWCSRRIPSLFAYAQSHYWNNGFLKYWTMNNLPNFLFGAPTIALSAFSIKYFASVYPVGHILPISIVNGVFLIALLLLWHVQIVTRIHTFLPQMYWLLAGLWAHDDYPVLKVASFGYLIVWNVVQPALFAAFLPPA